VNEYNDITIITEKQALMAHLNQHILGKLPPKLEESAKEHGAIVRKREIKSAVDLLTMMLVYALTDMSQRMLAAFAALLGTADVSDQSWQKKTAKCEPWLKDLLNKTLPKTKILAKEKAIFGDSRIKLVDGSCVKQAGAKGETLRIHMCYDLTLGCMDEALVTDQYTAESFKVFNIIPGSIYLADAGFGKGKNLQYISSRDADAVFRVTPSLLALSTDSKGKEKIDMTKKLDAAKDVVDFKCFVHTENRKYMPARIIASRLPEDKVEAAMKRKRRAAQKRQSSLKAETLLYAQWVIIMTTLDERYAACDILKLYRARWQIELLFKRIKQFFKVVKLRPATVKHSKVLVLLWLIIWSLTEREATAVEIYLMSKAEDISRLSPWTMCGFFLQCFKAAVYSILILCSVAAVEMVNIYKRLRNHKSGRLNQYALLSLGGTGFLIP
jgi:hypothetical protein